MFNNKDLEDYAALLERQGKSAILMAGVRAGVALETSQPRIEQINPFKDDSAESQVWLCGFCHGQSQLQSATTRIVVDAEKFLTILE